MRRIVTLILVLSLVAATIRSLLDRIGDDRLGRRSVVRESSNLARNDDSWLPCCSGGWSSMSPADRKTLKSAKSVFVCGCCEVPS
ncbi:MAG: hypothetical protein EHM14_02875 [Methanothrix sp.]|nr:MAG: hypothetical protein EHM14_02875 [Methanothrix sp.]